MKTLYTAEATLIGGRNGRAVTSDNSLDLELRSPIAMGGPQGKYSNPEQLFACGYAACFQSALEMHIRMAKIQIGETQIDTKVHLNSDDKEGFSLSVEMQVKIPDLSKEQAEEFVKLAHQTCPYSKAIRNNVDVKISVV